MTEKLVVIPEDKAISYLDELWPLRKKFFSEYPYLQDNTDQINIELTKKFLSMPGVLLILAFDNKKIAIAAVSVPFIEYKPTEDYRRPYRKFFYKTNTKPEDFIQGIWTLSKPKYRNKGITSAIGNLLNEEVKRLGYKGRLMENVVRPINDVRAPEGYLAASKFFLEKRGYVKIDVKPVSSYWTDIGDNRPTEKILEHYVRWV